MSVLVVKEAEGPLPTLVDATISNVYHVCSSRSAITTSLGLVEFTSRDMLPSEILYVIVYDNRTP